LKDNITDDIPPATLQSTAAWCSTVCDPAQVAKHAHCIGWRPPRTARPGSALLGLPLHDPL